MLSRQLTMLRPVNARQFSRMVALYSEGKPSGHTQPQGAFSSREKAIEEQFAREKSIEQLKKLREGIDKQKEQLKKLEDQANELAKEHKKK